MPGNATTGRVWPPLLLFLILLWPAISAGQSSNRPELALPVLQEARALAARGEVEAALEKAQRALTFARAESGGFDPLVAFVLDDLGTLNYRLGRLDEALAHAEEALAVILAARGPASTGHALIASNLASILSALERPADALPLYRDALPVLERNLGRTHPRTAATARNLATVQEALGEHAAAVETYALAIEAWREVEPDGRTAARLMVDRAEVLLRLDQVEEAGREAGAARALLEAVDPAPVADLAHADLVLADVDLWSLRPLAAHDRLLGAAAALAADDEADSAEAARVQSRLASLDLLMGDAAAARRRLTDLLDVERRRRGPDDQSLGVLHRRVGEALLAGGEPAAAETHLEQALDLSKEESERALASALLALAALETGQLEEALRRLQGGKAGRPGALRVLERGSPVQIARLVQVAPPALRRSLLEHFDGAANGTGSACRQARASTALALFHRDEGAYPLAEELLERAAARLDRTVCPDGTALEAALALADFRLADGMADAAIGLIRAGLEGQPAVPAPRRLLERALDLVAGARAGTPQPTELDLMLRIAQGVWQGEQQAIDDALAQAVIESGRPGADRLLDRRRRAGSLQARLRLLHGLPSLDPVEVSESGKDVPSDNLRSELKELDEIDQAIRRDSPELARLLPRPLDRTEVQATLGPGEAVLLQVTGARASHLFLLRNASARYAQTSMTRADLAAWVEAALLQIGDPEADFDSFALHALYVGLVSPFADALRGVDHLIVLPDGAARRLPLGALVSGPAEPVAAGRGLSALDFLVERVALSTIGDLTSLTSRRAPSKAPIAFAGFAAPASADEPVPDRVRAARLQAITASLAAEKALLDLQAAKSGIMALDLNLYRTLAFAMPVARDARGLPALALAPGSAEDGRVLALQDLANLGLDADLVLLLDDDVASAADRREARDLLPALALSGARAVLTTYWAVGPDPVSRIAGPAVQAILTEPTLSPAQALREAVLPLIAGEAGAGPSHPGFWAPFGVSLASR